MALSKESLAVISSLGALALVTIFFIMPTFDSVNIDRQIASDKLVALEEAKLFNQRIAELNSQYKSEELEKLLSVLPKEEELSALLIQLEGLATSNGLIMESVDFSKIGEESDAQEPQPTLESEEIGVENGLAVQTTKIQPYKILLVSLKLNGDYNAFKNYLQAVEKNLRLMDVVSMSLGGNSIIAQNFSFSINLQVYYQ
jgi:Tfp pilus assembly protein PilO